MTRIITLIAAMLLALGMLAGPAMALENAEQGFDASPAFVEGQWSYVHQNDAPRFDTNNHRIAIDPTQPGENSNSDVVNEHGDDTLLDPLGTL